MRKTIRHRSQKPPKRSRTIPVYGDPVRGDGRDANDLYRCWYCGQINSITRQTLGDADSPSGAVYDDYSGNPLGTTPGTATLGGVGHTFVAQKNGSDGNPTGVTNAIKMSNSGSGCSHCGTLNWRGDY